MINFKVNILLYMLMHEQWSFFQTNNVRFHLQWFLMCFFSNTYDSLLLEIEMNLLLLYWCVHDMKIYRNNIETVEDHKVKLVLVNMYHLHDLYTLHKLIMKLYGLFYYYLLLLFVSSIPHEVLTCHKDILNIWPLQAHSTCNKV